MDSIFTECRQCGTCCKKYRRIVLKPSEVEFISRMGGHVGVQVSLNQLRNHSLQELVELARAGGKVYMIHPDGKGCVFLERRNDKYYCKIYHYRPAACRGFRCNFADSSLLDLLRQDALFLLDEERNAEGIV